MSDEYFSDGEPDAPSQLGIKLTDVAAVEEVKRVLLTREHWEKCFRALLIDKRVKHRSNRFWFEGRDFGANPAPFLDHLLSYTDVDESVLDHLYQAEITPYAAKITELMEAKKPARRRGVGVNGTAVGAASGVRGSEVGAGEQGEMGPPQKKQKRGAQPSRPPPPSTATETSSTTSNSRSSSSGKKRKQGKKDGCAPPTPPLPLPPPQPPVPKTRATRARETQQSAPTAVAPLKSDGRKKPVVVLPSAKRKADASSTLTSAPAAAKPRSSSSAATSHKKPPRPHTTAPSAPPSAPVPMQPPPAKPAATGNSSRTGSSSARGPVDGASGSADAPRRPIAKAHKGGMMKSIADLVEDDGTDILAAEDGPDQPQNKRQKKGRSSSSSATSWVKPCAGAEKYFGVRRGGGSKAGAKKEGGDPWLNIDLPPLRDIVRQVRAMPLRDADKLEQLLEINRRKFPEWTRLLKLGFNMLLHGFGSKRNVLADLADELVKDGDVFMFDGREKDLNKNNMLMDQLRQHLERRRRAIDVIRRLELRNRVATPTSSISNSGPSTGSKAAGAGTQRPPLRSCAIRSSVEGGGMGLEQLETLYIVVNDLTGRSITPEILDMLLSLVKDVGARIVASVDHINAPFMFTARQLAGFEWLWAHAPTYMPYDHGFHDTVPAACAASSSSSSSAVAQRQLGNDLKSLIATLAPRHRDVLIILSQHQVTQLKAPQNKSSAPEGLTVQELLTECKKKLVVQKEHDLRDLFVELRDHGLLVEVNPNEGRHALIKIPKGPKDLRNIFKWSNEESRRLQKECAGAQ